MNSDTGTVERWDFRHKAPSNVNYRAKVILPQLTTQTFKNYPSSQNVQIYPQEAPATYT